MKNFFVSYAINNNSSCFSMDNECLDLKTSELSLILLPRKKYSGKYYDTVKEGSHFTVLYLDNDNLLK
jgi:hypothetical protein